MPLLRSIPYLGALFRWNKETRTKTNLMVFLRPTIVRSKNDLRELSQSRYNALRNLDQAGAKGNPDQLLPDNPQQTFDTPAQKQAQPAKAVQP